MPGLFTVLAQLFIDGAWQDYATSVRSDPHITVERGSSGWLAKSNPTKVTATLHNTAGTFSPRNPGSPLYGKIGRNTRMRIAVRPGHATGPYATVTDTFTRTSSNTWGNATSGQAWTQNGSGGTVAGDFNVAAGEGTHSVNLAGGYRFTYLTDLSTVDSSVAVTFKCPQATGANLEPANIMIRGTSITLYVLVRVAVTTSNTVTLTIFAADGTTLGTATVASLTHTGTGQPLRVRVYATGQLIFARVWIAANAEPTTWDLSVQNQMTSTGGQDNSSVAGFIGIRSGRAVGNTNVSPVVFSYDNFEATPELPRAVVEIPQWPQDWDHKGVNVRTSIEGYGPLARAQASTKPERSAAERTMLARYSPQEYWPMEGGSLSEVAFSATNGSPLIFDTNTVSAETSSDIFLGSGPLFVGQGLAITGQATNVTNDTSWSAGWAVAGPASADLSGSDIWAANAGGAGRIGFRFQYESMILSGAKQLRVFVLYDQPGPAFTVAPLGAIPGLLLDGNPHTVQFSVSQAGATITLNVYTDGVLGLTVPISPPTIDLRRLGAVEIDNGFSEVGMIYGHFQAYDGAVIPSKFTQAVTGYVGEFTAARLHRLCTEEGYGFQLPGDDIDSGELMGPQLPGKFADLLDQCRAADRGYLYEARDSFSFVYRTRATMPNPTTALALDYNAHHFIDAPRPDNTFEIVANRVVATRTGGQTYVIEDTTGPLGSADPPVGAGLHEVGVDLCLASDDRLVAIAQWILALGTIDEEHFPSLKVELASSAFVASQALTGQAADIDIAEVITIDNLPSWVGTPQRRVLMLGTNEDIWERLWSIDYATAPADAYYIGILGDPTQGKLDAATSTLSAAINSSVTSMSVASTSALWTTDAADMTGVDAPLKVVVGGEIMTVTAIAGASSPQTFTVTRASPAFAHPAGTSVKVYRPMRLGP